MADIIKSIGSAGGRDYSTIGAWAGDLDASGVYSAGDNAIGECYNDSDFNEFVNLAGGGTIGLNSIHLTAASGHEHSGVENTGVRLTRAANSLLFLLNTPINSTIDFLEFTLLNNNAFAIFYIANGFTENATIKNCLIYNVATIGANAAAGIHDLETSAGTINVLNNIIYGIKCLGTGANGARGINHTGASKDRNIINNTVYGTRDASGNGAHNIYMLDDSGHTYKNNIGMNPSGSVKADFSDSSPSNAVVSNNMSSDASAPGDSSLTNQTPSFVSTVEGSENLKLTGGNAVGAAVDLGTSPSGVNIDILGFDRDSIEIAWDIGAHQFTTSISAATATALLFSMW